MPYHFNQRTTTIATMMNEMESIDSDVALNDPKSPTGNQTSDGQPRVGELFFIRKHHEDDLSSINSYPTTYSETEMLPTFTNYPQISNISNYADSIVSESTTISSVTHNDILPMKTNNRSILSAFRKKTVLDITESSNKDNDDDDELLGYIPSMTADKTTVDKTWVADIGHLKSTDTDLTVDLENQPSQEESTNSPEEDSVLSKADSSFSSFSEGFGGFIYQNCSELNPFNLKIFIMAAFMLLLIGVSAVVAAVIVDGNSTETETNIEELTSVYELPPWEISVPEPSAFSQKESESVDIATIPTSRLFPSTAPTDDYASNDGLLDWEVINTSTLPSETTAPSTVPSPPVTSPPATSPPVTMSRPPSSTLSTVSSSTSPPSTSSPTTSSSTPTTSSSSQTKLSAIVLYPVADSKLDKNDRVARFDVTRMVNDGRGRPFKVLMRIQSSKYDGLSLNYLPKAGLWDCSPCDESEIQSTNFISVGTFEVSGDSVFLDIAFAFQRGIFDSQMTFQFHSHKDSKKLTNPEMVVMWVEGDAENYSSMTVAQLIEQVSLFQ